MFVMSGAEDAPNGMPGEPPAAAALALGRLCETTSTMSAMMATPVMTRGSQGVGLEPATTRAAGTAAAPVGVPQSLQKRAPALSAAPHFTQRAGPSGAPQAEQNLPEAGAPQLGHGVDEAEDIETRTPERFPILSG